MKAIRIQFVMYALAALILAGFAGEALASETSGTIISGSSSTRICKDESCSSYSTVNWKPTLNANTTGATAVAVTDSGVTGWLWGDAVGWVNMQPTGAGVTIDPNTGALSGHAYANTGSWINFSPTTVSGGTQVGVTITSAGELSGWAYVSGANGGWMKFDCTAVATCIKTDWRPVSARSFGGSSEQPSSGGGGSGSVARTTTTSWWTWLISPLVPQSPTLVVDQNALIAAPIVQPQNPLVRTIDAIIPGLIPQTPVPSLPAPVISAETPLSLAATWNLVPEKPIADFVIGPLPAEIRMLAIKFPELGETFRELGIARVSDLDRLKTARFVLPGLDQVEEIPTDIVFAKSGDLINYSPSLTIADDGTPEQLVSTIVGKRLDLVIKPDHPVASIDGYLLVKDLDRVQARKAVPETSILASALTAALALINRPTEAPAAPPEEKLVLERFSYSDPDGDGIYTASIQAPLVHGEYEVVSVVEYEDVALGSKEFRLIAVVDPEGYVYRRSGADEARIGDAVVTLYHKDPATGTFLSWDAGKYQQVNPQRTDKSGTYSFLVPEGTYRLGVTASGYGEFTGQEFEVRQGRGVHENIELKPEGFFRRLFGIFR